MNGRSDTARFDSRNSVIFSLKNQVGGLARALQVFQVSKLFIYYYNIVRMKFDLISKQTFRNILKTNVKLHSEQMCH